MNKQIDEMRRIIDKAKHDMWVGNTHHNGDFTNHSKNIAEALYNAGYRKQSEGEWIAHSLYVGCSYLSYRCSNCGESDPWQHTTAGHAKYCPKCGAKMKGGE